MSGSKLSDRTWWVRLYRVAFGLLIIAAAVYQLDRTGKWANFFSFFTIQSNLIGSAVLLIGAIALPGASRKWDLVRGAAAIYLVLTGIVYNTLLVGLAAVHHGGQLEVVLGIDHDVVQRQPVLAVT